MGVEDKFENCGPVIKYTSIHLERKAVQTAELVILCMLNDSGPKIIIPPNLRSYEPGLPPTNHIMRNLKYALVFERFQDHHPR